MSELNPIPSLHPPRRTHVLTVMGTRPEAVKLAPVIRGLEEASDFELTVASTGQHREMLDQIVKAFALSVHRSADIFLPGQSLPDLMGKAVSELASILEQTRPDVVMVQGDTTSAFAGALAAFYADVPVVHLEAGLRTTTLREPYPEEMNRRLTSRLAALHLAPTDANKRNLLDEGVAEDSIFVSGNTVIDALLWATALPAAPIAELSDVMQSSSPVVLVTAHRRESWGPFMRGIAHALRVIATDNPHVTVVFPIHRNPIVRNDVLPTLHDVPNVLLTEPLPYVEFAHLLDRSYLVLTDSGGIQEEAPTLGKPVLVMRDETERHEAIAAGTAQLVGREPAEIAAAVQRLIDDAELYHQMAKAVNPYGDGLASERVVDALRWKFAGGSKPREFDVDQSAAAISINEMAG